MAIPLRLPIWHKECGAIHMADELCPTFTKLDLMERIAAEGDMEKKLADMIQSLAASITEASHNKRKMRKLVNELKRTSDLFQQAIIDNTVEEKPWYFTRGQP